MRTCSTPDRGGAGWSLDDSGSWWVFGKPSGSPAGDPAAARHDAGVDPLRALVGTPGLWRTVWSERARSWMDVFETPHDILRHATGLAPFLPDPCDPAGEAEPLRDPSWFSERLREWALVTADGPSPLAWSPPPRGLVESWIPAEGLTLRVGPIIRQGELLHAEGRLTLRIPLVPRIATDLSPSREAWLCALLIDAQNRWRMVRVGPLDGGASGGTALIAEVDLSGAPGPLLEPLFRTGLGALRWLSHWLVASAVLVADGSKTCRLLEVCTPRGEPAERNSM